MRNSLVKQVEESSLKKDAPKFEVGDSVDVHTRIIEGDKERIQVFSGTVIMRKGDGINANFTVRRIVNNEGVERIFPLHSPKIEKLEVKRKSRVRRAKLYYLRERTGKATRLKEGAPIILGEQAAAVLGVSHGTIRNTLNADAALAEEITAARFQAQLQPLACVIVGGMLLSPICSLLVIPVLARFWMPTIRETVIVRELADR